MPLISSLSAGAKSLGLYVISLLVSVTDNFNRANNTTDLGSIRNQKWKIWRGAWQILSNKAYSDTAASTNALATLTFTKTDVTVSISGQDPGMGASFWVTDANNWYASVYTQTQVCQTCSGCAGTWNASNCPTWNTSNCPTFNVSNCLQGRNCNNLTGNCALFGTVCCAYNPCNVFNACNSWGCNIYNSANTGNRTAPYNFCYSPNRFCTSAQNCTPGNQTCSANCCNGNFPTWSPYCSGSYNACTQWSTTNCTTSWNASNCASGWNASNCASGWNAVNCASGWNASNCNAPFTFSCNCVVEHRVNILKSIAGTVSTISTNLFGAAIASFKTLLSGNQATITAFASISYTDQIGGPIATNISPAPTKTNMHGIIKSSSPFSQGTSIDDFGAD